MVRGGFKKLKKKSFKFNYFEIQCTCLTFFRPPILFNRPGGDSVLVSANQTSKLLR